MHYPKLQRGIYISPTICVTPLTSCHLAKLGPIVSCCRCLLITHLRLLHWSTRAAERRYRRSRRNVSNLEKENTTYSFITSPWLIRNQNTLIRMMC